MIIVKMTWNISQSLSQRVAEIHTVTLPAKCKKIGGRDHEAWIWDEWTECPTFIPNTNIECCFQLSREQGRDEAGRCAMQGR